MKKLFIIACCAMFGLAAHAQKGVKTIGANLLYAGDLKTVGIGVKGQYGFTKQIRGEASFDYFFEKDNVSAWDVNVNFHYLFPLGSGCTVYPLVGATYIRTSWDDVQIGPFKMEGDSHGEFGLNLGGGFSYALNKRWTVNAEIKYQFFDGGGQFVQGVGVTYRF